MAKYQVSLLPTVNRSAVMMTIEAYDVEVCNDSTSVVDINDRVSYGPVVGHAFYNFLTQEDSMGNARTVAAIPADMIHYVVEEQNEVHNGKA